MTDWHCPRCKYRIRLYQHVRALHCVNCDASLHKGKGHRTTKDPRVESQVKEGLVDGTPEEVSW